MQELEKEGRDRERKGWEMPREGERVTVFFVIYIIIFYRQVLFFIIDYFSLSGYKKPEKFERQTVLRLYDRQESESKVVRISGKEEEVK